MPFKDILSIGAKRIHIGLLLLVATAIAAPAAQSRELHQAPDAKATLDHAISATANAKPEEIAMAQSYLGHAPYICSASGFGQKPHCFLRESVQSHR